MPESGIPPGVSFVVCTRNRHVQLAQCLAAFARLPASPAWELIIVDNGSSPAVAELACVRSFPGTLRCIVETQPGAGAARDTGWRHACYPVVAFVDDDCYVAPDYVAHLLAIFARDPGAGFVGGRITLFDPADLPITIDLRTERVAFAPRSFLAAGAVHTANLAIRRDILEAVGGMDRQLGAGTPFACEDIELAARILWCGYRGVFDPAPSVAHHHGRRQPEMLHKLQASYDRGRGAYYGLFLLRPDSRGAYLRGWLVRALRDLALLRVGKVAREIGAARRVIAARKSASYQAPGPAGPTLIAG